MEPITSLTLPDRTRTRIVELLKEQQVAIKAFRDVLHTAVEMMGLDPSLNHSIDFSTGVITPAVTLNNPSPSQDIGTPLQE